MVIKINIVNKRARTEGAPVIVCGNADYSVRFTFDEEWASQDVKTVRFVYVRDGAVRYTDVVTTGDTVAVPVMANTREVRVGVFAGDLRTSTPARIPCERSIRCGTGAPADPTPSQYDQIMELLSQGVTEADIAAAIEKYLQEHPIEGATQEDIAAAVADYLQENPIEGANVPTATPDTPGLVKLAPKDKWSDANLDENSGMAATPRMVFEAYTMIEGLFNAHVLTRNMHVSAEEKAAWNAKLGQADLQAATDAALAQAKERGEFDGAQGEPGEDAISPTVAVADIDGGHRITITDVNGTKTVDVMDGAKGDHGKTAYQYAQDGGYAGTEEEFGAKLALIDAITVPTKNTYSAIPSVVHIAIGKEFRIYYKNVISRYADRLWIGYTSGISVKRYDDYLSVTATEETTKNVSWKIYDDTFNVLDSGTMKVIATADIAKTSKVLVIGDSTVTQSNAISQKLLDCYSGSNGNLTLLGTRGTSPALHEGRAGWTSTMYCTSASHSGVTNPFYNNGFDFSYYMTQQGYSGVDIVVIQLGINDIFSMTHENFNASTTLSNLDDMIDSILEYDSNIKVVVNLISPPNDNGTSFTDTYNTTQIDFVYLANTIRLSNALIEHFATNDSVSISPNNCVLDATTDINDGVHPNATGYAKLGQAIYETINGIYEESGGGGKEPVTNELWDAGDRTAVVKSYAAATDARTIRNDCYYYPAAYTGAWSNNYEMSNVQVGANTLQFVSPASAFGIFVPFLNLDSSKKYRFTVNPIVSGFRVYLVKYDSTGVYKSNDIIVDKNTGLTAYEFTPTADYQQGFCFACLSGTKDVLGSFTDLSLVEVTE